MQHRHLENGHVLCLCKCFIAVKFHEIQEREVVYIYITMEWKQSRLTASAVTQVFYNAILVNIAKECFMNCDFLIS